MFAGHIAAGVAIARAERRVNLALFVGAALLLDLLVWVFILLGWESVRFPADFARSHQAAFVMPYSHGLMAALLWSALAAVLALAATRQRRLAFLVAAAVFSHWLLDFLVHRPELPLAGASSPQLGLALWDHMALALSVEAVIVVAALWLFLAGSGWPRGRARGLVALLLVTLALTVAGLTLAPPPPSAGAMAVTSLATLAVVCGFAAWLGRRPGAA